MAEPATGAAPTLVISVAASLRARHIMQTELRLPAGARIAQALALLAQHPEWASLCAEPELAVAIWGERATPSQLLHDGDRLELLRRLRVDPKVARRERFQKQGARSAGLFATRRPGAKPGY
jgi:uncharacterized protein